MSSANKDYILRFAGEDATGPAFEEIIARAKAAGAKISAHLNGGMGGKPEWLESLKGGFGRESAFGGIGEILRGGGAVIGISAAAEAIKGVADGVDKIHRDSEDADKNWADLSMDALQSVPVFGSIAEAGAAISEISRMPRRILQRRRLRLSSLIKSWRRIRN